ncbi:MAG: VIT1/CCC1 transporter family protein [Patescibacteria group bacterium]
MIKKISSHIERHFRTPKTLRNIVLGIADGLTVPFALAAAISGALYSNNIVIVASLAEIAAGTISMGLGGYLVAKSDAEHYKNEERREHKEVKELPETELAEVKGILRSYGLQDAEANLVATALQNRPQDWVDFMMRFELGLEHPHPREARNSAFTLGISYAIGGIIPLSPYFFIDNTQSALIASSLLTLSALFVFGYVKGVYTSNAPFKSAIQTTGIGGLAAATAFTIARLIT